MVTQTRYLLLLLFAFCLKSLFAQVKTENYDKVYGFDPLLYNGKIYSYLPNPGTTGTQYIFDSFEPQASVTLRGVSFSGLSLNYDLYNQQVVLKYKNALGSVSFIDLSLAWLENFDMRTRHFEVVTENDTSKRIYQVLGIGPDQIRIYHYKTLLLDSRTSSRNYFFADTENEMYLYSEGKMTRFRKNKSLISAFDPARQDAIRKYLRKNKIKVQKAKDVVLTELINYCNTLPRL